MANQKTAWQLAGGTILGRRHRLAGRNNQDALCCLSTPAATIAVVCDGCGSGAHSEFGAQLGARLIAHALLRASKCEGDAEPEAVLQAVRCEALHYLQTLADAMGGLPFIADCLLFTVIGAYLTEQEAIFFALGDGLVCINDTEIALGPFENNAPPYLAYGLLETSFAPAALRLHILRRMPADELQSFLLGTDGVCDLRAAEGHPLPGRDEPTPPLRHFWKENRFFNNRDSVRRTLAGLARDTVTNRNGVSQHEAGLLPDDTTLIVGRRAGEVHNESR